ncbi:MAG TPA: MoxR family ATPase [Anaerolineae bacterium]|nr:MoxR family ATPase [Anaerolineae bacterium]
MDRENQPVALWSERVLAEMGRAIVGKEELLQQLLTAALASGGHVLLEDFPGLAKTLIARSFAAVMGLTFKRIQFTPDLLPGDITGGYIYDRNANEFVLREGPIFANIVLADEINRASPKTQSALLEAMQEYQVTLEGETRMLPQPFLVIATQNPIEYEGTFPLPEAQLDRFIMKLSVGYPDLDEEQMILARRREHRSDMIELKAVTSGDELLEMRQQVERIHVDDDVEKYMVALAAATRKQSQVIVGASPRGSLALLKLTRAWAALQGRSYVIPDDVKCFARPALRHRLILDPALWLQRGAEKDVIGSVLKLVPVPITFTKPT